MDRAPPPRARPGRRPAPAGDPHRCESPQAPHWPAANGAGFWVLGGGRQTSGPWWHPATRSLRLLWSGLRVRPRPQAPEPPPDACGRSAPALDPCLPPIAGGSRPPHAGWASPRRRWTAARAATRPLGGGRASRRSGAWAVAGGPRGGGAPPSRRDSGDRPAARPDPSPRGRGSPGGPGRCADRRPIPGCGGSPPSPGHRPFGLPPGRPAGGPSRAPGPTSGPPLHWPSPVVHPAHTWPGPGSPVGPRGCRRC